MIIPNLLTKFYFSLFLKTGILFFIFDNKKENNQSTTLNILKRTFELKTFFCWVSKVKKKQLIMVVRKKIIRYFEGDGPIYEMYALASQNQTQMK